MRWCICTFLAAFSLCAQSAATNQSRLVTIRETTIDTLFAQPNYTCLETIDRRHEVNGMVQMEDRLRLEVAIVNGTEMFGWPGAESFEDLDATTLARGGLFSSGNFGIYPRMLFYGNSAIFSSRGESTVNGRRVLQHDFVVPKDASGFHVQRKNVDVTVGFRGSIFTDPASSVLIRLVAIAESIPPEMGITEAEESVDYGYVHVGEKDFLLPIASESRVALANVLDRNRVRFSNCARFGGESRLILDEDAENVASSARASREVILPVGVELQLSVGDLALETAAVGDSITATLSSDVKSGKTILIPKGATAAGRIMKLNRYANEYQISLRFARLEWASGSANLSAQLKAVKSGKASLGPSGDILVNQRPTPKLTGLSLTWKVKTNRD